MDFLQELEPYIDSVGLVQDKPGSISGNGLLYTAEAVLILTELNQLDLDLKEEFLKAIKACEVRPGLYERHPTAYINYYESIDDYIGLGVLSYYLDQSIAQRIVAYGRSYFWCMNNVNPGKFILRAWLGRFPAMIAHLKWAAGITPPLWQRLYWFLVLMFQPWKGQDEVILSYLMIHVADNRDFFSSYASKAFYRKLYQKFPNGLQDVFTAYWGKDHPITKYINLVK